MSVSELSFRLSKYQGKNLWVKNSFKTALGNINSSASKTNVINIKQEEEEIGYEVYKVRERSKSVMKIAKALVTSFQIIVFMSTIILSETGLVY